MQDDERDLKDCQVPDSPTSSGVIAVAKSLVSGSFAGCAATVAGAPFDTIKVRCQTAAHLYKGPYDCLVQAVRNDGPLSLYSGVHPALAAAVIENTVLFGSNALIRRAFLAVLQDREDGFLLPSKSTQSESLSVMQLATVGGMSGVFSATAICPADLIKCRLQAQATFNVDAATNPGIKQSATSKSGTQLNVSVGLCFCVCALSWQCSSFVHWLRQRWIRLVVVLVHSILCAAFD
jgi:hypothetical protein